MSSVAEQILAEVELLPAEKQEQILEFVRALSARAPIARSGADVAHLAGTISAEDLAVMRRVADEECEQIDPHAW